MCCLRRLKCRRGFRRSRTASGALKLSRKVQSFSTLVIHRTLIGNPLKFQVNLKVLSENLAIGLTQLFSNALLLCHPHVLANAITRPPKGSRLLGILARGSEGRTATFTFCGERLRAVEPGMIVEGGEEGLPRASGITRIS